MASLLTREGIPVRNSGTIPQGLMSGIRGWRTFDNLDLLLLGVAIYLALGSHEAVPAHREPSRRLGLFQGLRTIEHGDSFSNVTDWRWASDFSSTYNCRMIGLQITVPRQFMSCLLAAPLCGKGTPLL